MKRPTIVAVSVALLAVLVATVLAVALWDRDDDWGPGMMASSVITPGERVLARARP